MLILIFNVKEAGQPTRHDVEAHKRTRTLLMEYGNKQGKSRHAASFQDQNEKTNEPSSSSMSKAKRSSETALYEQISKQVQTGSTVFYD